MPKEVHKALIPNTKAKWHMPKNRNTQINQYNRTSYSIIIHHTESRSQSSDVGVSSHKGKEWTYCTIKIWFEWHKESVIIDLCEEASIITEFT